MGIPMQTLLFTHLAHWKQPEDMGVQPPCLKFQEL
jgi:hypothetical protein